MNTNKDTIAAISTPKGTGAIAIVRINGENSLPILNKIFSSVLNKKIEHGRAVLGSIENKKNNTLLDQVIVIYYKAPNSFTGEDLIEISCHGGQLVVQMILQLILDNGARLAEPGEFSTRAFLNGKIDLVQAESIIDIIHASSQNQLKASLSQLSGKLSQNFTEISFSLKDKLALLELELDFNEEDIEFAKRDELYSELKFIYKKVSTLIDSFHFGRIIREGAHIVISGKPNVGKSSLLNKLLDQDRAIVSEIPGTTRDSIEESLNINGYLFKITDTAGLRNSTDIIEQQGVDRTKKLINQADIILHIFDASDNEYNLPDGISFDSNKHHIVIFNKLDIVKNIDKNKTKFESHPVIFLSAKTGEGIELLENKLVELIQANNTFDVHNIITKVRHRDALIKAESLLQHAITSMEQNLSPEFIALDLRAALDHIGEITGIVTTDDILNDIFDKFCIGK